MEDLMEHSGEMTTEGEDRYNSQSLAPEFMTDDQCSHNSGMEVNDRLTYLEQRVQMQEDEIQWLKMTMADVMKKLNISEEKTAALTKRSPAKAARPASLVLTSRATTTSASSLKKSYSSTLPSFSTCRNYSPAPASRRTPDGKKDSPSPASVSSKARTTASTTTCKKTLEIKPKKNSYETRCNSADLSEPPVKKDWVY